MNRLWRHRYILNLFAKFISWHCILIQHVHFCSFYSLLFFSIVAGQVLSSSNFEIIKTTGNMATFWKTNVETSLHYILLATIAEFRLSPLVYEVLPRIIGGQFFKIAEETERKTEANKRSRIINGRCNPLHSFSECTASAFELQHAFYAHKFA